MLSVTSSRRQRVAAIQRHESPFCPNAYHPREYNRKYLTVITHPTSRICIHVIVKISWSLKHCSEHVQQINNVPKLSTYLYFQFQSISSHVYVELFYKTACIVTMQSCGLFGVVYKECTLPSAVSSPVFIPLFYKSTWDHERADFQIHYCIWYQSRIVSSFERARQFLGIVKIYEDHNCAHK